MKKLVLLTLAVVLIVGATPTAAIWGCSVVTDMFTCLECASELYDQCSAFCDTLTGTDAIYIPECHADCLSDYNADRRDCNDNFDPIWQ